MISKSLRELVTDFLKYKRSLGYSYVTGEYDLRRLLTYTDKHFPNAINLTKDIVKGFLEERAVHEQLRSVADTVHTFGKYLLINGYTETYLIPSHYFKTVPSKPPYFFTPDDINGFFTECDNIRILKYLPGRNIIIPALFRLMYCCGLRSIEIRKLRCKDVHLDKHYLDILSSKGFIDRRIWLTQELVKYLDKYNRQILIYYPNRYFFFPGRCHNGGIGEGVISYNFAHIWDKAFPNTRINFSPRAYDFRHHLAYYNINKWACEGSDINAKLPYLMRYMGHNNINHTLYYFHFVPSFFNDYKNMTKGLGDLIPEVEDEK